MFCPQCAAQNIDGASFCRVCGANISLIPQALSGKRLALGDDLGRAGRRLKRRGRDASIENALKNIFMGLGFIVLAVVVTFPFRMWWAIWMLIPGCSLLGKGVAEYMRFQEEKKQVAGSQSYVPPTLAAPPVLPSLPARNTGELVASPPSVTEGTTRHLGAEAPTRHLDAESDYRN